MNDNYLEIKYSENTNTNNEVLITKLCLNQLFYLMFYERL